MELVSYTISRKRSDHTPIVIAPIGDIQWHGNSDAVALDALKQHIARCQDLNAYYVLMGDATDFASPSNRQRLRAAALYDNAEDVLDSAALRLTEEIYEMLKPLTNRTLGVLSGHHYHILKTGITTDMKLCEMLNSRFLGTSGFIRLQFECGTTHSNVVIWGHHGVGGGSKAAAPVNKLESIASHFDADIFLMGHQSRLASAPINRIIPRWDGRGAPDLIHRKILLVGTGSWAKAYVPEARQGNIPHGGYAEAGMMQPAVIGAPLIYIRPSYSPTKEFSYDVSVEV